ncbi:hypothetical protein BDFB_001473, partial [Asbolus verrucosus]
MKKSTGRPKKRTPEVVDKGQGLGGNCFKSDSEVITAKSFILWYQPYNLERRPRDVSLQGSDEVWFHLEDYVNSQNTRTWSTQNHPLKIYL